MVIQIIDENKKKSFADKILSGVTASQPGIQSFLDKREISDRERNQFLRQQQEKLQENEFANRMFGEDIHGLNNQKSRENYFSERFKGQSEQRKKDSNHEEDEKNYNFIKDNFGQKTADLYKAAPQGGKTKIIDHVIDTLQRGGDVEESISPHMKDVEEQDKGLTPKERVNRQKERYSANLPLYQEANSRYQSLGQQREHLDILKELSPGLTGAMNRLNINPQTGDLVVPALASPELQRYVKTINDFTTSAKDSYGARVTNFDLQQFMRRLPTLANSEEGRAQILEQMSIITELNELREKAIIDTIDKHGGIRNIDYDVAERLADKSIKGQVDNLRYKLKGISSRLDSEYNEQVKNIKSDANKNKVAVQKSDGSMGYIPKEKLSDFLKVPGNKAL